MSEPWRLGYPECRSTNYVSYADGILCRACDTASDAPIDKKTGEIVV